MNGNSRDKTRTAGKVTFCKGEGAQRLFRVEPGIASDYALEQASMLMGCVRELTFIGVMDNESNSMWAAHYLSSMAKALVDDVEIGARDRGR
ncbi:hypothetical protein PS910_00258 [Pseudomonas fluorescens]|nr:hypothetical protein PS910_00258 [Pseudomonas fluorescens]